MKEEEVFTALREVGCCNGCCARFLGLRTPQAYARLDELALKYTQSSTCAVVPSEVEDDSINNKEHTYSNGRGVDADGPAAKKRKWEVCVCCLGVLQKETWPEALDQVAESLAKNGYDSKTFACALSSPACIALREKSLVYHLQLTVPTYTQQNITPLKEAWKWSFGPALESKIGKSLDSGAVCPLLITVHVDYDKDAEELETLRGMAPAYYAQRARDRRHNSHPQLDTTRRCVHDVLERATRDDVSAHFAVPPPRATTSAHTLSVRCEHTPLYIAGRYIKLSRRLSQTPWVVEGQRMMESSVQDVIFQPIVKFFRIAAEDVECRLKLLSSGREDVDVRCLGDGRPFAVEVSDPHRTPTSEQLQELCGEISAEGSGVVVRSLRLVDREALALLKKGEDSKEKTYKALCIKLPKDALDQDEEEKSPTVVTEEDLKRIREYSQGDDSCRVKIQQKTPLRVLHRRPLLTRERRIIHMDADRVAGHPNLFTLSLRTDAGTYVKEFVHGDLGRTRPCLRDVLAANVDILALDVTAVDLPW